MGSVRARIVGRLPAAILQPIRGVRDRIHRIDARIRRQLPQAFGGRFDVSNARVLVRGDVDSYLLLRHHRGNVARRSRIADRLDAPDRFCVGVHDNQRLIGVVWCVQAWLEFTDAHFCMSTYVHPGFRRRAAAQVAYRRTIAEASRRGLGRLLAHVNAQNAASLVSLRAVGFELADEPRLTRELTARLTARGARNHQMLILVHELP